MKSFGLPFRVRRALLCGIALLPLQTLAQGTQAHAVAELHAHIDIAPGQLKGHPPAAVVWLTPMSAEPADTPLHPSRFTLVQKNRMFMPHLLVVPVGSVVSFPNEDPFFHNVFSYFNGKRFDLGLYEAGKSKDVTFSREGVSYIFCNIHPEMGAVVLALSTPYYGVSTATGAVAIHDVPPGSYRLHVWSEAAQFANPVDAERIVQVGAAPVHLDQIFLQAAVDPMEHHKNKFGDDYHPSHDKPY